MRACLKSSVVYIIKFGLNVSCSRGDGNQPMGWPQVGSFIYKGFCGCG